MHTSYLDNMILYDVLFLLVIDCPRGENGLTWRLALKLDHLDYADDIALISSMIRVTVLVQMIEQKTNKLVEHSEHIGLTVSIEICKVLRMNSKSTEDIIANRHIKDNFDSFGHLGTYVSNEGESTQA